MERNPIIDQTLVIIRATRFLKKNYNLSIQSLKKVHRDAVVLALSHLNVDNKTIRNTLHISYAQLSLSLKDAPSKIRLFPGQRKLYLSLKEYCQKGWFRDCVNSVYIYI